MEASNLSSNLVKKANATSQSDIRFKPTKIKVINISSKSSSLSNQYLTLKCLWNLVCKWRNITLLNNLNSINSYGGATRVNKRERMEYISNINKRAGEIIRKLIIRRPLPPEYYQSIEIYYWRRTIKFQENKEVHLLHFFKKFTSFVLY